jgi:ATP-dependent helicase HrpA
VQVQPYWDQWKDASTALSNRNRSLSGVEGSLREYRWMLEEFRVSLFAQELGTARPVSAKRLDECWKQALTG